MGGVTTTGGATGGATGVPGGEGGAEGGGAEGGGLLTGVVATASPDARPLWKTNSMVPPSRHLDANEAGFNPAAPIVVWPLTFKSASWLPKAEPRSEQAFAGTLPYATAKESLLWVKA